MTGRGHHDRGLLVLAVFKMIKAALLFLAGAGAFTLLSPTAQERARDWLTYLTVKQGHSIIERSLHLLNVATPWKMTMVGIASICYGMVFGAEGIGLWLERRWAEYLTVIATGSLIPFEIYELARALTIPRALALGTNTVAVLYLIYRLRHPPGAPRRT